VRILKLWLPVLIWAGIIFWLSNIPNLKTDLACDFILRKAAHVVEYAVLCFLLRRAFKGSFKMGDLPLFLYPAILSFFYAVSDEFHQSFIPGRNGSFRDVLIDTVGIIGFYIVLKVYQALLKKGPSAGP